MASSWAMVLVPVVVGSIITIILTVTLTVCCQRPNARRNVLRRWHQAMAWRICGSRRFKVLNRKLDGVGVPKQFEVLRSACWHTAKAMPPDSIKAFLSMCIRQWANGSNGADGDLTPSQKSVLTRLCNKQPQGVVRCIYELLCDSGSWCLPAFQQVLDILHKHPTEQTSLWHLCRLIEAYAANVASSETLQSQMLKLAVTLARRLTEESAPEHFEAMALIAQHCPSNGLSPIPLQSSAQDTYEAVQALLSHTVRQPTTVGVWLLSLVRKLHSSLDPIQFPISSPNEVFTAYLEHLHDSVSDCRLRADIEFLAMLMRIELDYFKNSE